MGGWAALTSCINMHQRRCCESFACLLAADCCCGPTLHHSYQVADLLREAAAKPLHLRTSLAPLDAVLLGGLPAGSVTEVRAA